MARDGLALSEQRGIWRLEPLHPGADPRAESWGPGAPPPVLAEAADPASFAVTAPMRPVATCEGHLRTLVLRPQGQQTGQPPRPAEAAHPEAETPEVEAPEVEAPGAEAQASGAPAPVAPGSETPGSETPRSGTPGSETPPPGPIPLTLSVLEGELRTVTLRMPCARVWLEGEDEDCLELALMLAGYLPLAVPRLSLAAEALAAATGRPATPRRLGPPGLPADLGPADAFARVIGHLTDVVLHWAPLAQPGQGNEPVHQMRVALRRMRAGLSAFRRAVDTPSVQAVAEGAKQLSGLLGPARDWDVFVSETGADVADAFAEDKAVARLLSAAERRRVTAYAALRAFLDGPELRCLGLRLAGLAGSRAWHAELTPGQLEMLSSNIVEFAGGVMNRRLKRVLQAGDDIDGLDPPTLHQIRLDGKRLRYAAEIFAPLFNTKEVTRFQRRLAVLQERLGTLNDGAVTTDLMAELANERAGAERAYAAGVVRGFVAARGRSARADIGRAWDKFLKVKPFW